MSTGSINRIWDLLDNYENEINILSDKNLLFVLIYFVIIAMRQQGTEYRTAHLVECSQSKGKGAVYDGRPGENELC